MSQVWNTARYGLPPLPSVDDPKTLARCPQVSHYWNALLQDAATWRYHFSLHHLPDGPASLAALLMEHHRGIVQSVGTEKEPRHAARHAVKLVLLGGIPSSSWHKSQSKNRKKLEGDVQFAQSLNRRRPSVAAGLSASSNREARRVSSLLVVS
ncbi:hypothetical protein L198_07819 [Cryptococcus wingfieldii CBS 7118]|uniref:F-box domain-containing protein n=1 Tax=Cryptococcus wingfieldii CBS 7118 TaxID=1295528 RepID=A0A1E3HVH3_9TREE|nr:hypothetical protein L198_07819 [Cryptococcus wingfieldii CBS 7118]ODN80319.1 hypothetical protein L198_07819 [Cryptococcus wingfieldii CBS 7118]